MKYTKRHHRRRHAFSKRKEAAIKAIAMGPVETKKYSQSSLGFVTTPTGANQTASLFNIFFNVPKGTVGDSEQTVIGNKFIARGVKFYFQSNNTSALELKFRATVFSTTADLNPSGLGVNVLGTSPIYEQDVNLPISLRRFDTQVVRVLKSKVWSVKKNFTEQVGEESFHTMWVPITGQKTSRLEETPGVNTVVGNLKGVQYFLLIEAYQAGSLGPTYDWGGMVYNFAYTVYFKDP